MALNLYQTQTLLGALERSFLPQTLFRDVFFPNVQTFVTKSILMDYRKGNRQLAPFVTQGGSGVNVDRVGYKTKEYEPPMLAPQRPLTVKDLDGRAFGENVFSQQTPEQRAALIVAQDMADLMNMNVRSMEWMCAQLMVYGGFTAAGYADDEKTQIIDTVTYPDWTQKLTLSGTDLWSNASSDAYSHLEQASQTVARNSGMLPTVCLMSYKTKEAFLNNASILSKLMIPSRDNLTLMSLQPRIVSPGVVRIGYIESLNLELYAYDGIYQDSTGAIQQYLPDGYVILGVPGRGSQLFAAVTQLESDKVFRTYQGANVPKVWSEEGKDTRMLRVASKGVPKPEFVDDWYTLKVL